ncbi:carbohydrate ABC transporter permease [Falsiroseomonas sp.]|uniref:carbohydrate ABC transporter permease n=1 Tax=Falsiroseomonas sp. TaxID=2870721 RepID=UPI00356AE7AF
MPYLFLTPFFLLFGIFWAGPILASFAYSFTEWRGITAPEFVGLRNYADLFADERFYTALGNTLWMAALYVVLANLAGLSLALLLDAPWMPTRHLFRTAFFLPMTISMVVTAVIFQLIYAGDIGLLAKLLSVFGLEGPAWLRDPATAPLAIVAMRVWRTMGYYAIIYLAGLQAVSSDLKEAARLDGASEWQVIRHVILPGLKPVMLFCVILTTISALEMFDEPMVLTQGGPGDATLTAVMYVYQQGFQFLQLGYAAAASYVLTLVIVLISIAQKLWLGEKDR